MTKELKEKLTVLKMILSLPQRKRLQAFSLFEHHLDKAIREVVLNTLNKNIPLSDKQKHDLSKYKNDLRLLARNKLSKKRKKRLIVHQQGKGIPLFLSILLPALDVISSLATNNE